MKLNSIVTVGALAGLVQQAQADSQSSQTERVEPTLASWANIGVSQVPNIANDSAIDANLFANGYNLQDVEELDGGLTGLLELNGATNLYGVDFDTLNLTVNYEADERLNVNIQPVNLTDVYVLPDDVVRKPRVQESGNVTQDTSDLVFEYTTTPFTFNVTRKANNEVLFSTTNNPLVFSNTFIQFNTSLPKDHQIAGLGESMHSYINEPGVVKTFYATDSADTFDRNIYGVHPFYLDQRYGSNYSHGVYWRTSAIQEVLIGEQSLTWRALSGVIDLYFFSGPKPVDVTKQYVAEIGLPTRMPYWALGYHQSRWGYDSVDALAEVVENFKNFGLKLETMWSDIDYMQSYRDFTNDHVTYPLDEYKEFVDELHGSHQHYVPIVDSAIYIPNPTNTSDNYTVYEKGYDSDVFIKNPDGTLYIGALWPGYTVFPDWLANKTQEWWTDAFKTWYQDINFDGIWLDMNEVSSVCVGSCGTKNLTDNPILTVKHTIDPLAYPAGFEESNSSEWSSILLEYGSSTSTSSSATSSLYPTDTRNFVEPGRGNINYPPYVINNVQAGHDLAVNSVSPNATHADGTLEYDIHNLWGFMEEHATYNALLEVHENKRPFIISRSTFAGSGQWTGHWGGDNTADWPYMYFSIPQALSFGLYGIPFFGVDTCGFVGNADMELCSRWMQLSSFFPFYRNHNTYGTNSQEPYLWSGVLEASITSMDIRYLLLPYYYTLLEESHTTGVPVMRALSWVFPDTRDYSGIDTQFFVGDSLLVTPVLEPGVNYTRGIFPGVGSGEVYYDWYTKEMVDAEEGQNVTLDAPLGHIPFFIRGGSILPTQEPGNTTYESRQNPYGLIIATDSEGKAQGKLYLDDGESHVVEESLTIDFTYENNQLSLNSTGEYELENPIANVTVIGLSESPKEVELNGYLNVTFTYANGTAFITELDQFNTGSESIDGLALKW